MREEARNELQNILTLIISNFNVFKTVGQKVPKEIKEKIQKFEEYYLDQYITPSVDSMALTKEQLLAYIIFFALSDNKEPYDIFWDINFFDREVKRYEKAGLIPNTYKGIPLYGNCYKLTLEQITEVLQFAGV